MIPLRVASPAGEATMLPKASIALATGMTPVTVPLGDGLWSAAVWSWSTWQGSARKGLGWHTGARHTNLEVQLSMCHIPGEGGGLPQLAKDLIVPAEVPTPLCNPPHDLQVFEAH